MQVEWTRRIVFTLAICSIVGLVSVGASGQHKRRRRSRRHSKVAMSQAAETTAANPGSELSVISTDDAAGKNSASGNQTASGSSNPAAGGMRSQAPVETDQDHMRRTITKLSGQVNQLTDKLTRMEEEQRTLVDMERLTRAEQRAENLRVQLRDVEAKQSDLQARAEQLDYEIQPENIERALAPFGTTHPEVARETRKRQLESEKTRVRTQLDSLATSRTRLESDIASADADITRLRTRLDAASVDRERPTRTPAPTTDTNAPAPATGSPNSPPPNQTNPPV